MVITPDSTITLYSGVDIGTDMQLAFSSATKQAAYFATKVKKAYVNCTTVKDKIGAVRVAIKPVGQAGTGEITGHDLASCNYMSFINPSFDNKTIYCYIVDYKYLNNETAEIYYMIDYWQTWLFDVSFNDMYIDREHLSTTDWAKVESNPYDKTVPQMVTAEPLPTPMGYEKPFYEIQWWHDTTLGASDDDLDGRALLHTGSDMTAQNGVDLVKGDWNYWNVMLVLAPTDWDSFNSSGVSEEDEIISVPYRGIVRDASDNWYMCIVPITGAQIINGVIDSSKFKQFDPLTIADGEEDPDTHIVSVSVPKVYIDLTTDPIDVQGYVYDETDDCIYFNNSATTCVYHFGEWEINAQDFSGDTYKTTLSSNVALEYQKLIRTYNIIVNEAGNTTTKVGGQDKYPWTCKPKGCDILFITESEGWRNLALFFTKYNAVSQIIGIYGVPANVVDRSHLGTTLASASTEDVYKTKASAARTGLNTAGVQATVRNKKLLTSPYSYYRVISPDGHVKEYQYEKFADAVSAYNNDLQFRIILDSSGDNPKMYFIPYKYNVNNALPTATKAAMNTAEANVGNYLEDTLKYNIDEAMCVTGFPEISFNTDGYLTFLASEYMSIRGATTMDTALEMNKMDWNTNETKNKIGAITGALGGLAGGLASGADKGPMGMITGGLSGLAQGMYNVMDASGSTKINREIYENEKKKYAEAAAYVNGNLLSTDDPYVERYKFVKPAYANSNYTGGTGGIISYLRGMGLFDFVGIHVQLRPEILSYFDSWFDMYGYASGRCGIPYVVQWCRSSTGDTYASTHVDPHWVAAGGTMVGTTYVKTMDCKVEHAMMPVANAIKQMFDRGIRFKKGDLS